MTTLTCERFERDGTVARYVAGTLPAEDVERFEAHYLTCATCQGEVRLAAAVRSAVAAPARRTISRSWLGLAGLLAAAGLAAILFLRPTSPDPALAALGEVDTAPIYLGVAVREEAARADSLFEDAMRAYASARYADAARGLRAALEAGIDPAPAEFFLASSLLQERNPEEAEEGFARVVALGETPYRSEARFYRAKALLQLGRGEDAADELRRAAAEKGEMAGEANDLLQQVEAVRRR